ASRRRKPAQQRTKLPTSDTACASGSSNHTPPEPRYRKCTCSPAGTVTETLRVPLLRRTSRCAPGCQPLKLPTADTGPSCTSSGSTKLTFDIPVLRSLLIRIAIAEVLRTAFVVPCQALDARWPRPDGRRPTRQFMWP